MTSKFSCEYCENNYKRKDNYERHKKSCKSKLKFDLEELSVIKSQLKDKDEELNILKSQLKDKDEHIKFLQTTVQSFINKPTVINYKSPNNSNMINNFSIKDIASRLEPIDFEEIKNSMHLFDKEFIDKGIEGFANFLCQHPCKNKLITTDYTRNIIAYNTKTSFVRDPDGIYLINKSIQDNSDSILEKAFDRKNKINKLRDDDGDLSQANKNKINLINKLHKTTENIQDGIQIKDKDASNVLSIHGSTTIKNLINTNNAIE